MINDLDLQIITLSSTCAYIIFGNKKYKVSQKYVKYDKNAERLFESDDIDSKYWEECHGEVHR